MTDFSDDPAVRLRVFMNELRRESGRLNSPSPIYRTKGPNGEISIESTLSKREGKRLRELSRMAEPLLLNLGAKIPVEGRTEDGRLIEWAYPLCGTEPISDWEDDEETTETLIDPFALVARGIEIFLESLLASKQNNGSRKQKNAESKTIPHGIKDPETKAFINWLSGQSKKSISGVSEIKLIRLFLRGIRSSNRPEKKIQTEAEGIQRNLRNARKRESGNSP